MTKETFKKAQGLVSDIEKTEGFVEMLEYVIGSINTSKEEGKVTPDVIHIKVDASVASNAAISIPFVMWERVLISAKQHFENFIKDANAKLAEL